MKKLRKLTAVILAAALLFAVCIIDANAAIPPQTYGDINIDDSIDILDATLIQRHIAQLTDPLAFNYEAADVNNDADISVLDVTIIQRYVAGIISTFPAGKEFFIDKYFYDAFADYDSGKAMVGVPVTFRANGYCEPAPTTVKLYVNNELVAQTSECADDGRYYVSHTFEETGKYDVVILMCDKWGEGLSWRFDDYKVVETPDDTSKPVITSITRDSATSIKPEITAVAQFGTAPYEYKFTFEYFDEVVKTQDFSEDNTFDVTLYALGHPIGGYTVHVTVKDAAGNTATESYNFERVEIEPA